MKPIEFLQAIWPSEGIYCLATPFQIPGAFKPDGSPITVYAHKTFDTIQEAVQAAKMERNQKDIFFAVHTLSERKVWNETKLNRRTGELGAYEVRCQPNMKACKAFFFDLDVGPDTDKKYATREAALEGIKRFCMEAQLPKPLLTSSGGGVHVYWPLTDAIPSPEWKQHAIKLRALAEHHGLRFDPSRTVDESSVLRVVGTFNHKKTEKRPVEALTKIRINANGEFLKKVADAMVRGDVIVKSTPFTQRRDSILGSNMEVEYDGPKVGMKSLITVCKQVQHYLENAASASEPEWYHMLNLIRFTRGGAANVHKASEKHPRYNVDDTEAKIAQLEGKNIKPTSCMKLAEVNGDKLCEGCMFAGKVKNPLMAARYKDPAPRPVVQQVVGPTTVSLTIPDAPFPYQRGKDGKITRITTNKNGDEIPVDILAHDLYPLRRVVNKEFKTEQHVWRATLPRSGERDFILDADALYDRRKFVVAISNSGIFPAQANLENLQGYMIAYIAKLQAEADAEAQCNHLGWIEDQTQFIMPDKILLPDGTAKPAQLSKQANTVAQTVFKKGTLERQVELMRFYADPAYVPAQFMICAALASPIFFATGHHGVVVNATGEPGASKSTTLYAAAGLWGDPEPYSINGTNKGMTANARNERMMSLANLPICVDEITKMKPDEASDMVMNVTQSTGRVRLYQDGTEKPTNGAFKSAIMLTTANSSLHGLLSTNDQSGTAGSVRVFEITFKKQGVHDKTEADAFLRELKKNFGHIGDAFMSYVVPNIEAVRARVETEMAKLDTEINAEGAERFLTGAAAAALVGCEIGYELGLLPFDVALIRHWIIERQFPHMRHVIEDSYSSPTGMLTDFIEIINAKMIIMGAPLQNATESYPVQTPHGELLAHYEVGTQTMWILRKGFRDYCMRTGANVFKVMHELAEAKIVTAPKVKKVLGKGTAFAKSQSWCFQVDMAHPEIAGKVEVPEAKPVAPPVSGKLRVVDGGKA